MLSVLGDRKCFREDFEGGVKGWNSQQVRVGKHSTGRFQGKASTENLGTGSGLVPFGVNVEGIGWRSGLEP